MDVWRRFGLACVILIGVGGVNIALWDKLWAILGPRAYWTSGISFLILYVVLVKFLIRRDWKKGGKDA